MGLDFGRKFFTCIQELGRTAPVLGKHPEVARDGDLSVGVVGKLGRRDAIQIAIRAVDGRDDHIDTGGKK